MCCFDFLGNRETHKQNSQEISGKATIVAGQSWDNLVKCLFICILVVSLSGPNIEGASKLHKHDRHLCMQGTSAPDMFSMSAA